MTEQTATRPRTDPDAPYVRAWAKREGLVHSDRGRMTVQVWDAWREAGEPKDGA